MTNKDTTPISDEMLDQFFKSDFFHFLDGPKPIIKAWESFKSKHSQGSGRDWEITKVIHNGAISFFSTGRGYTMEEIQKSGYDIYQVRRPSDGEVFTINDKVEYCAEKDFDKGAWAASILKIKISEFIKDELVFELADTRKRWTIIKHIRNIRKVKAPTPEQKPETRPPLGIMPEWLWKEKRLQDIRDAIERYLEDNRPIPVNWIAEEYALRGWFENHNESKIKGNAL